MEEQNETFEYIEDDEYNSPIFGEFDFSIEASDIIDLEAFDNWF